LFSSTIDQVAANYASPLTVEGAHAPDEIEALIRRALRHIYAIILPTVAALVSISPWLLRAFGHKYASAAPLLDMLLIACLPKAVSTVYYAYCRVQRSTHRSAIIQAYVCTATLSAVVLLARSFGLIGVGFVIVIVQSSAGAFSWWTLRREFRRIEHHNSGPGRLKRQRDGHSRSGTIYFSVTGR
jgi:O-antigen/teichoic acid export membrane protein